MNYKDHCCLGQQQLSSKLTDEVLFYLKLKKEARIINMVLYCADSKNHSGSYMYLLPLY
jgi:hypothetical protein